MPAHSHMPALTRPPHPAAWRIPSCSPPLIQVLVRQWDRTRRHPTLPFPPERRPRPVCRGYRGRQFGIAPMLTARLLPDEPPLDSAMATSQIPDATPPADATMAPPVSRSASSQAARTLSNMSLGPPGRPARGPGPMTFSMASPASSSPETTHYTTVAPKDLAAFPALVPTPLVLDARSSGAHAISHIRGTMSLSAPKFSLTSLSTIIASASARRTFDAWLSAARILVYDTDLTRLAGGSGVLGLLRKIEAVGFKCELTSLVSGRNTVTCAAAECLETGSSPSPKPRVGGWTWLREHVSLLLLCGPTVSTQPSPRPVHVFKRVPRPPDYQFNSWETQNLRAVQEMLENLTVLPGFSIASHQRMADKTKLNPKHKDWKPRPGPTVRVKGDRPTVLCDRHGKVAAVVIPNYIQTVSLANLIDATRRCMKYDLAPKKKRSKAAEKTDDVQSDSDDDAPPDPKTPAGQHVSKRHQYDVPHKDLGFYGVKHYCHAWHATGHEHHKSFEPSRDLTKNGSNLELSRRFEMLDSTFCMDYRIKHLLSIFTPPFFELLRSAQEPLSEYLAVDAFAKIWHNPFFGRAVAVNQETGEHLDVKGVRRGMDVIVAGGYYTGGELYLIDLDAEIPLLPGTLAAFDGTTQRHRIQKFEGSFRFSHVYFVHHSVFDQLGIDTTLPDLTIDMMQEGLEAARPKGPPNHSHKRKGEPIKRITKVWCLS
ncbi:hypothetical protein FRC08_009075 [Ceratobasidium sp. 394]|nr:hypothetical protein FRC08_009075 [Ceratobasidium sp. 394]